MLWDNPAAVIHRYFLDDGLLRALKTISIPEPLSIYRKAHALIMNEAEICNLSRCNLKHRYRNERLCATQKRFLDLTNSKQETFNTKSISSFLLLLILLRIAARITICTGKEVG